MKRKGTSVLVAKYHLTLEDAGLKGLYIVMIRSRHRHMFNRSEKV